ncbi:Uncharacterised protein [Legionella lansingensis]|uniref:Fe-S protein n=1 Tax=Legionella lansingensis TaxID=45067 RepID=A0A0W0VYQ4_9GAMM|nr:hypothetical protein [Legionella lansingensis]KTD25412.1 hypothetical protein Llan_0158 [Legionella lansingensis]SNV51397.1 Uncharacterised protein [Legionella lansingensis]
MKKFIFYKITLPLIILAWSEIAIGASTEAQPPNIGNFALPTSQQPGPFLSFGQNIIDKNQIQIYFDPNYQHNTNESFLQIPAAFLYGLTDEASILVTLPVAADYRSGPDHSSGIADISVQGEFAFYENSNSQYTEQMTFVTALTVPTGSFSKNPPTGFGSVSSFLGGTYNHMSVDWLWFTSPGVLWITKHSNIKLGSQYLYQFGVGRNIKSVPNQYIFSALVEIDGTYIEKDKISGKSDPNSGGNLIFLTPSLWYSTKTFYFQLGFSIPIEQEWNGNQSKINYYTNVTAGWTFN